MYCTQCGKENSGASKFCMYCGTALAPPQPTVPPPPSNQTVVPPLHGAQSATVMPTTQQAGLPAGLKRILIVVGIAAIVLLVLAGGSMAAGRYWLRLGANNTANMMPDETDIHVAISPGLRQMMRINDLSKLQVLAAPIQVLGLDQALPTDALAGGYGAEWITVEQVDPQEYGLDPDGVMKYAGAEGTFSDFRQGILTEDGRRVIWVGNKRLGRIEVQEKVGGIDLVEDVQSWIGLDAGIGLMDIGGVDPGFVIIAATRNVDASDSFLDKLRMQKEFEGSSFDEMKYRDIPVTIEVLGNRDGMTSATINRYVIIADRPETMESVVDTIEGDHPHLAKDETYQAVIDRLPGNRLGSIYIGKSLMADFAGQVADFGVAGAFEGMGMGISLEGNGAKVDIVSAYDTDQMSRDEIDYLRRDGHKVNIVEALPDDAILVQTGYNLSNSWRPTVTQFPDINVEDLDYFLEDSRQEMGVDLEEDIFNKMTGEFALAFMPAREDIFGLGFPVSFLFLSEISRRDQKDVERAMQDILTSWAEDSGVTLDTRSVNGVEMQIIEDSSFDFAFGYGMIGDYLVVGTSLDTLRSATDASEHPLAKDETYRQGVKQLPGNNHGVFYLGVENLMRFLRRSLNEYDRQDFEDEVEPFLEPLASVSGASLPTDKNGYQRTVLYLQLTEE